MPAEVSNILGMNYLRRRWLSVSSAVGGRDGDCQCFKIVLPFQDATGSEDQTRESFELKDPTQVDTEQTFFGPVSIPMASKVLPKIEGRGLECVCSLFVASDKILS